MSILDWFRRKPPTMTPEEMLFEALRQGGILPAGAKVEVRHHKPSPPPSPADTWANWQAAMEEFAIPGWSPCQFGTRVWHHDSEDRVVFLFGIARGDFGIYTRMHPICWHDDDDHAPTDILATLSHLRSGVALGAFRDRATAGAGADALLSSRVDIPWGALSGGSADPIWRDVQTKADAAWAFNGFCVEDGRHAHVAPGGPAICIWAKTAAALIEGKPEKLS